MVYGACLRVVKNPGIAEEVAQESFLELVTGLCFASDFPEGDSGFVRQTDPYPFVGAHDAYRKRSAEACCQTVSQRVGAVPVSNSWGFRYSYNSA